MTNNAKVPAPLERPGTRINAQEALTMNNDTAQDGRQTRRDLGRVAEARDRRVPDPGQTVSPVAPGYCECGCGQQTAIAPRNRAECGWVKGKPQRYLHLHHPRGKQRQWQAVLKDTGHSSPCHIWLGPLNSSGYARVMRGGVLQMAHRYAYEAAVGPIPAGLEIDHLCMQRRCVNPEHLEPVTHEENNRRARAARQRRGA